MQRHWHAMLPTKRAFKRPERCIYFDVETRVSEPDAEGRQTHTPFMICACYTVDGAGYHEWQTFSSSAVNFWTWAMSKVPGRKRGGALYLFAHNAAFDLLASGGIDALTAAGYQPRDPAVSERVFILEFFQPRQTRSKAALQKIVIVNVGNWWEGSVEALGEAFGLEKLPMPEPMGHWFEAARWAREWFSYCRRDVEIIRRAMESWFDFCEKHDLGAFRLTAAAQAFYAYRRRFMPEFVEIHTHPEAERLERAAYYGARTECYRLGEVREPVAQVDVNSMFPYAMTAGPYPQELVNVAHVVDVAVLSSWLAEGLLAIADVTLATDEPAYPFRHPKLGLLFPVGQFRTTLATPELKHALAAGRVREVHSAAIYRGADLFTSYVDYFYRLKQTATDEVTRALCKLMLNSLYGKFGQRQGGYLSPVGPTDRPGAGSAVVAEAGGEHRHVWFGGQEFRQAPAEERGSSFNAMVAIAAHVTSYARMYLWGLMEWAGRANVLYVDTDSLIVNGDGLERLKSLLGDALGALRVETAAANGLILHGCKDLDWPNGRQVRRGIPKDAVEVEPGVFEFRAWPSFETLVGDGITSGYQNRRERRTLTREYVTGWVHPDGKVHPFEMFEGADLIGHVMNSDAIRRRLGEGNG